MDSAWVAPILLAALGIVASCVGGLIWVIKYLFEQIMPVQREIKTSIDKNTKLTETTVNYLRQRSTKDASLWKKSSDSMKEMADQVKEIATQLTHNGHRTDP